MESRAYGGHAASFAVEATRHFALARECGYTRDMSTIEMPPHDAPAIEAAPRGNRLGELFALICGAVALAFGGVYFTAREKRERERERSPAEAARVAVAAAVAARKA